MEKISLSEGLMAAGLEMTFDGIFTMRFCGNVSAKIMDN